MTPIEGDAINIGAAIRGGLRLKTVEVVALLHNACEQLDAGTAAVLHRSAVDLWVTDAGTVVLPRIAPAEPARATVAALLEDLLPQPGDGVDEVPRALRSLPARLREAGGQTPGVSEVKDLLTILRWHLPTDSREVLRDLVMRVRLNGAGAEPVTAIESFAAEGSEPEVSAARDSEPERPGAGVSEPRLVADEDPEPLSQTLIPAPVPHVVVPSSAAPSPARSVRKPIALAAIMLIAIGAAGYAGYQLTVDRITRSTTVTIAGDPEPTVPRAGRVVQAEAEPPTDVSAPPAVAANARALDLPVPGGAFSPSFAAGGTTLVFHAGLNTAGRLFQASLDTSGRASAVKPLLDNLGRTYHPRPSPDGEWVAFDSDRDGVRGVYVASRDGAQIARVSGAGFAAVPSWSPDMKWLAYVRAEPERPKVWNLWLRDVATGAMTRESQFRSGQVWGASWFPDARSLCYSHEDQLIISTPGAGKTRTFASPIAGRLIRTPAVSPDGKRIVFQVFRDGAWLLDVESGTMRRILADPTAEEFAWDPDGDQIAYHSRRDGRWRIWLLSL